MKVTLKNIKENRTMSEETPCFSASLYLDGKLAGVVLNHGHGSCHSYTVPLATLDRLNDLAKEYTGDDFEPLDAVVYELLEREEVAKHARKFARQGYAVSVLREKAGKITAYSTKEEAAAAIVAEPGTIIDPEHAVVDLKEGK